MRTAAVVLLSGILASVVALASEAAPGSLHQTVTTESVDFAPGGTIHLKDSFGDLSVEAWDQPTVQITVTKSMGFEISEAEAKRGLDSMHVATAHSAGATELTITTTRDKIHGRLAHTFHVGRDVAAAYRIRVPRNSHLVIEHDGGQVYVAGVTGSVEASNRRGDIVLMVPELPTWQINAHTKTGVVTADVAGTMHRKHMMSEDFTEGTASMTHRLTLHVDCGGIAIKDLTGAPATPAPAM